jgi:hypothetical protein
MLRTLRIVLECILLGMLVMAVLWGTAVGVTTYFLVLAGVIAGLLPIVASVVATCDPRTAARMIFWATPLHPSSLYCFLRISAAFYVRSPFLLA